MVMSRKKSRFMDIILCVEDYIEASESRTNFYESPQNRCKVLTYNEDENLYYERCDIDRGYHECLDNLKFALREIGKTKKDIGSIYTFYENYKKIELRINEDRNVKEFLSYFGLMDELYKEWLLAKSMGARYRMLDRKYGTAPITWWKKKVSRQCSDRGKACMYRYEYKKSYHQQRKIVFKAIRTRCRQEKLDFKKIPLNGSQFFTVTVKDLI